MREQEAVALPAAKPANGSFNLLKVIVMLGLPFVHVVECYSEWDALSGFSGGLESSLCALTVFGPSVFMICMGLGLANTSSASRIRKIGIQMIIINELLNFIRFSIPYFFFWEAGLSHWIEIFSFFESDIYFFVGLFYILYSFFKEAKLSTERIFFISLVMLVIDMIFSSCFYADTYGVFTLVGNFVTVGFDSYFPLMGWFIYPCIGMLIEEKILCLDAVQRRKAFGIMLFAGAAALVVTVAGIRLSGAEVIDTLAEFAVDSRYGLGQVALIISIALVTISAVYFIYQLVRENPLEKFIISLSPLILPFYLFQWIGTALVTYYVISISALFFNRSITINIPEYLLISFAVAIISMILTCKKGFTFSRWLFRISDYTRWRKK